MSKKYEVVAVTGTYKDREGNEKSRYLTIGSILTTKNGFMLKLDAVPVGWDGWAYLNEPKEPGATGNGQRTNSPQRNPRHALDEDLPPI